MIISPALESGPWPTTGMAMADRHRLDIDEATLVSQRVAADPRNAAWVSANAGSGKTYVLAARVIRLMLDGVAPDTILCLTYTKTAAAEMKNRVFERLASWALYDDTQLRNALAELRNERDPGKVSAADVEGARTLFATALETPGGLKIQTIHAFCDSVLHRFPLEANIAGHFEQLDDRMQAAFLSEARNHVLAAPGPELSGPLTRLLGELADTTFDTVLADAVSDRAVFEQFDDDGMDHSARLLAWRSAYDLPTDLTKDQVLSSLWEDPALSVAGIEALHQAATEVAAKQTLNRLLDPLLQAVKNGPSDANDTQLFSALFKADGTVYGDNTFTKALQEAEPGIVEWYRDIASRAARARDTLMLLRSIELGVDLVTIVNAVLKRYVELKRSRGYLDFTDLIDRTRNLLSRQDVGPWVRYKLDEGIDHILVDEAQDTSPAQWDVIQLLSSDFFVGEGANPKKRTIFAVGDEKQSIYSFQGADPAQFSQRKYDYAGDCEAGERPFEDIRLQASFRSTADVLAAVDRVFAHQNQAEGLTAEAEPIEHRSLRTCQPGQVEIWEPTQSEKAEAPDDWLKPADATAKGDLALANRIADQIRDWLNNGEILEGLDREVSPGDVLILVRSRGNFVTAISRALKARRVAVAGADRLDMIDHPAVLDLLALGRFVLDDTDSLSLAELLKSPLFGAVDDDLFALVEDGEEHQTLFERLQVMASENPRTKSWLDTLTGWKERATNRSVFTFYAEILSVDDGEAKLVGRLGPETLDLIEEFLNEALAMERAGLTSLQQFIRSFDDGSRMIKREMDQKASQVRIMTVHGAKGLEAPVVFLVDNGSKPIGQRDNAVNYVATEAGPDHEPVLLVAASKADRPAPFAAALDRAHDALRDEYRRLLYVGMTRAADRLIVTGFRGVNGGENTGSEIEDPVKRTWYDMVKAALVDEGPATFMEDKDFLAWCFRLPHKAQRAVGDPSPTDAIPVTAIGDVSWMRKPAPSEPPAPRPLQPSGASVLAIEQSEIGSSGQEQSEPLPSQSLLKRFVAGHAENTDERAKHEAMARAARRGTAMHRLLQVLIDVPASEREALARQYLKAFDAGWTDSEIGQMMTDVMTVLDHPSLQMNDGADARNEVSVMGTIEVGGEPRAVSGVIDRLVVNAGAVHIIDYKTNARPPVDLDQVPDVYIVQMALYRALLAPLYSDRTIGCSLVYTSGPNIIDVTHVAMDRALSRIAQS